jgi:UDP-GlcNAc:undecaprenyl-phosphate GlcNAc-1-phosphate transferase
VVIVLGLLAIAASVYLVYVLELLKFTRRRGDELRAQDPETSEHEIVRSVERELETGEFEAVRPRD